MSPFSHAERVRARKTENALADGIDDALISELVENFYHSIRKDGLLGPIFEKQVEDWSLHLARMKDFWASIMLESGRFSGSPMQKHIAIGGLAEHHFARWQSLWDQTLMKIAPKNAAGDRFREAARRIGESLLTGIEVDRGGLAAISRRGVT